jgi:hypothetical protein
MSQKAILLVVWSIFITGTMMTSEAQAQMMGDCNTCGRPSIFSWRPFNQCGCAQACPTSCAMAQPVPVYQSVPVTEMRQVQQVVMKPITETKYVDQTVTEYQQVMEQKTAQIPQVSYQPVTQYQTQTKDYGKWVSYKECVNKVPSCQYDSSPTLLGWMNRTGNSVRNTFTPNQVTRRVYQPNVVAYQTPITRQVPVQTMQTVTYNVAKVVPITTTKKVAINTVRYENQIVTAQVPITVMKSVPVGTQTAFGFVPYTNGSGTQTATAPTPDPISGAKTAEGNKDPRTSMTTPAPQLQPELVPVKSTQPLPSPNPSANPPSPSHVPSIVQASGWRARKTPADSSTIAEKSESSDSKVELANVQH